jgi:hypothetical protein
LVSEELGDCPATTNGELVDRSSRGCKIRHDYGYIKPGQEVTITINGLERRAVVVWSRSLLNHNESGLSFLF